ncbi:MAG: dTMP kinase [Candidatus Omnitrophica bacterium]|nr:dTMP kinase [Candidatus Omnitrophota bacterium]
MKKGLFITFEGSEGSGKSTQIEFLRQYLVKRRKKVMLLREPGGVAISEKIRAILLDVCNKKMGSECETLLYLAARAQLVYEVIAPALTKGYIILCDRFMDSTVAYQGYGNGVDIEQIYEIGNFATGGVSPDLTFIFDLDAEKGLARIKRQKDRIEQRKMDYHKRVRLGYLAIAKKEPQRVKMLDATRTKENLQQEIQRIIKMVFGM